MRLDQVFQQGYIIKPEYKLAYVILNEEIDDFFRYIPGEEPQPHETKRQKRLRLFKEQEDLQINKEQVQQSVIDTKLEGKNVEQQMLEGQLETAENLKMDIKTKKQSKFDRAKNQPQTTHNDRFNKPN